MKCVAYDNRFQQELHETFPTWVPPPPKRNKKGGPKKAEIKKKTTPPRAIENRPRRAKHKRRNDSPVDTDTQSESDGTVESLQRSDNEDSPGPKAKRRKLDIIELTDDEEPQASIKYRARGTKSRPIF